MFMLSVPHSQVGSSGLQKLATEILLREEALTDDQLVALKLQVGTHVVGCAGVHI